MLIKINKNFTLTMIARLLITVFSLNRVMLDRLVPELCWTLVRQHSSSLKKIKLTGCVLGYFKQKVYLL